MVPGGCIYGPDMIYYLSMGKTREDEKSMSGAGKGYSILLVSDRTEKVRTIRLTRGKLILIFLIAALLVAGVVYSLVHGAIERKTYQNRIEELEESK